MDKEKEIQKAAYELKGSEAFMKFRELYEAFYSFHVNPFALAKKLEDSPEAIEGERDVFRKIDDLSLAFKTKITKNKNGNSKENSGKESR